MPKNATVLVHHFAGQIPLAGIAWQAMNYVLALKRLGYDVWYVEDNGVNPYSPQENQLVWDSTANIAFVRTMMERFDLGDRWAYWDPVKEGSWHGLSKQGLFDLYKRADALINLCGSTKLRDEHMACPVRILVDTDPGYEQIRLDADDAYHREFVDAHTHLFTYGRNIGNPECPIPTGPRTWHKTWPPVLLDAWPPDFDHRPPQYSSVATWQNKGKNVRFRGETYQWSKHVNFLRFLDMPTRSGSAFKLALITPDPKIDDEIRSQGWHVIDGATQSETMDGYADFIRGSRGEFTVAKDIYVRLNSAWFSDRSVCYLASGRPVIMQETGFSKFAPVGEGLFAFRDHDEAVAALNEIERDYPHHQRAARRIAERHFDARVLVGDIVRTAGL